MRAFSISARFRRNLWGVLALLLFARLVSMAVLPLTDTTESRYAEIARKMVETATWVTPQYEYGVPFWAKPPLSTWLSAASMAVFGVNEFAARLPSLLLSLGVLWLVWLLARERHNRDFSLLCVTLVSSLPLFFVAGGAVMTDASLAFATCISFAAFWLAVVATEGRARIVWGYVFFVGQGLGLLAKGPICGVLTLLPIFFWTFSRGGRWRQVWQHMPWVTGSVLMFCIAAPWYALAEQRTPGFLDYFILGEHFRRFLVPGWHGDKYGQAHEAPLGMIWIYWVAAVLPWSAIAAVWAARHLRALRTLFQDQDGWTMYLLFWAVWPMVFFTMAHNILWTYTLTGLPALALLLGEIWHRSGKRQERDSELPYGRWVLPVFGVPILAALAACLVMVSPPESVAKITQKQLVQRYLELRPSVESELVYLFKRYYSAEFYTAGRARNTADIEVVRKLLNTPTRDFIALKERAVRKIPEDVLRRFQKVETIGGVSLFEEKPPETL